MDEQKDCMQNTHAPARTDRHRQAQSKRRNQQTMSTRKKYKTRQYDELLAFLQTIPGRHVTVSELHDHFAGGDASIGTTTIYRHLERMIEEGLVRKYIVEPGTPACYAYIGGRDASETCYHCRCAVCGRLLHLHCAELPAFSEHILSEHRFKIDPQRTVFYGICGDCLAKEEEAPR